MVTFTNTQCCLFSFVFFYSPKFSLLVGGILLLQIEKNFPPSQANDQPSEMRTSFGNHYPEVVDCGIQKKAGSKLLEISFLRNQIHKCMIHDEWFCQHQLFEWVFSRKILKSTSVTCNSKTFTWSITLLSPQKILPPPMI